MLRLLLIVGLACLAVGVVGEGEKALMSTSKGSEERRGVRAMVSSLCSRFSQIEGGEMDPEHDAMALRDIHRLFAPEGPQGTRRQHVEGTRAKSAREQEDDEGWFIATHRHDQGGPDRSDEDLLLGESSGNKNSTGER